MSEELVETQRKLPFSVMRGMVETYYDFQTQRIISGNRLFGNTSQNNMTEEQLKEFGIPELYKKAESFEKDIKNIFNTELKKHEIYNEYLSKIRGIGVITSAGLLAYIEDISKFDRPSQLRQLAGYGMNSYCKKCKSPTFVVVPIKTKTDKVTKAKKLRPMKKCPKCDGGTIPIVQKRMSGFQSNWNDKFRVLCWKIGESFVKQKAEKSGYRRIYDSIRRGLDNDHPDKVMVDGKTKFNKGHLFNTAKRKTISIFLNHLWLTWRKYENLPAVRPYVEKYLGHDVIEPFTDE